MERGEGYDVGNDIDSGQGVGNCLDRGHVGVPSAAAAEGNAKMEHHQWYPATQQQQKADQQPTMAITKWVSKGQDHVGRWRQYNK